MRKRGVGGKYRKELGGGGVEGLRGIVFPGDAFEHASSAAASAAARHFGGWRGAGRVKFLISRGGYSDWSSWDES